MYLLQAQLFPNFKSIIFMVSQGVKFLIRLIGREFAYSINVCVYFPIIVSITQNCLTVVVKWPTIQHSSPFCEIQKESTKLLCLDYVEFETLSENFTKKIMTKKKLIDQFFQIIFNFKIST